MQYDFKTSDGFKTPIKGMTVFNTQEVNTKKQPMFFGKPLGVQRYDSYKYGWKTSYYQNTYDGKKDDEDFEKVELKSLLNDIMESEEDDCESCKI